MKPIYFTCHVLGRVVSYRISYEDDEFIDHKYFLEYNDGRRWLYDGSFSNLDGSIAGFCTRLYVRNLGPSTNLKVDGFNTMVISELINRGIHNFTIETDTARTGIGETVIHFVDLILESQ